MKDNFSAHASTYAQFRPVYPAALYDHLLALIKEHKLAWDCGCGNGQVAGILSGNFNSVIATDISSSQILHAVQKPNIDYRLMPAEKTDIETGSVNFIAVAQAIHWFNFEAFYKEVKRVSKPDALLAIWCYNLLEITPEIDLVVRRLYDEILGDEHWDPELKYIEEHYKTIPFPFKEIEIPDFKIEVTWNMDQLTGYLNSWSAVRHYINKTGVNPVEQLSSELKKTWGSKEFRHVIFPIYSRVGKVCP